MPQSSPSVLIDPHRLQLLLGETGRRFEVDALAECQSTNSLLLEQAGQGAPSGRVIVTDRQTAGRGSRGRSWKSAPEASLTFSLLWRFADSAESLSGLSLAVGVAVVQALESCGASGVTLKWPNDILLGDAKLGGILVELQFEESTSLAVIGIGLNLLPPPELDLSHLSLRPAALGSVLKPLPERHQLFAGLLAGLAQVLDRFSAGGFASLRSQWQACHAWQDRPVRLMRDGRVEKEGICLGADADGALLVQTSEGIERCLSGDVSLRVVS